MIMKKKNEQAVLSPGWVNLCSELLYITEDKKKKNKRRKKKRKDK